MKSIKQGYFFLRKYLGAQDYKVYNNTSGDGVIIYDYAVRYDITLEYISEESMKIHIKTYFSKHPEHQLYNYVFINDYKEFRTMFYRGEVGNKTYNSINLMKNLLFNEFNKHNIKNERWISGYWKNQIEFGVRYYNDIDKNGNVFNISVSKFYVEIEKLNYKEKLGDVDIDIITEQILNYVKEEKSVIQENLITDFNDFNNLN